MSDKLIALVRKRFGDRMLGSHSVVGDATVIFGAGDLIEVMTFLRDDPKCAMEQLIDVTAVDLSRYPLEHLAALSPRDGELDGSRYEVVYHLLSLSKAHRLRVKVPVSADKASVPSLCELWIAANWGEREAWDMFGVAFEGHPDLRRILLYEEFDGHPLRKDYHQRDYQPLIDMPHLDHYTDHSTLR